MIGIKGRNLPKGIQKNIKIHERYVLLYSILSIMSESIYTEYFSIAKEKTQRRNRAVNRNDDCIHDHIPCPFRCCMYTYTKKQKRRQPPAKIILLHQFN